MTKEIKVGFPRGVAVVHIPFFAKLGSYDELYEQIKRVNYPKNTRRIEATLIVSVDLRKGQTSYEMAEVTIQK